MATKAGLEEIRAGGGFDVPIQEHPVADLAMHRRGRDLAVPSGRGVRAINLLIHIPHGIESGSISRTEDRVFF